MVDLLSRIEGQHESKRNTSLTSDPVPLISRIDHTGLFTDGHDSRSMPPAANNGQTNNGHVPSPSASNLTAPTSPSSSLDESRQSLSSILFNNAKRRDLLIDEATIHDRIGQLVTNEVWESFSKNLSEIRRQVGERSQWKGSPSDSVANGNQKPVPSAPRAMVNNERVRVLENLLNSSTKEDLLKIIARPIPTDSSSGDVSALVSPQQTAGIPIPIDDNMFVKLPLRSEKLPSPRRRSVSPSQSSSSSYVRKWHMLPPPRSPSPRARKRRYSPSRSPPPRHGRSTSVSPRRQHDPRSPPYRTYRPYGHRRVSRSPSSPSGSPRRGRHARSPGDYPPYNHRTNGHRRSRFSRSPDPRRRSISLNRSEVSRPRRVSENTSISSLSHGHEEGALPTKMMQNDDKPKSTEESERRRSPPPFLQASQSENQIVRPGPSSKVNGDSAALPLSLRHPDEPKSKAVSVDHLQMNKEADDVQMQDSPMISTAWADNVQADDTVTEAVSKSKPSLGKGSTPASQPFLLTQLIKSHPCVAPGIWWAHPGASSPNVILPAKIEVNITAESLKHMRVTLNCLPTKLVTSALSSVQESSLLQKGSNILSKIDPHWPKKGSLLVEVNGHGFFPRDMDPDIPSPLLDISLSMKPGTNIIQIIQLSANREQMFLILASPAAQTDKQLESLFETVLASQLLLSSESLLHFTASVVAE